MANYSVWTVEGLGSRIVEWRSRLQHAKTREQLLSIWGEIEVMEAEFDKAVFENRTERSALASPSFQRSLDRDPHAPTEPAADLDRGADG